MVHRFGVESIMGIPVSKSRAVEVDGQQFRWMVRKGTVKYNRGLSILSRVLTVQEAKDRPGAVLQVTLWPRQWSADDGDVDDKMSLVPADVIQVIQEALVRGWEPSKRKTAFKDKITIGLTGWSTVLPPTAPAKPSTRNPAGRQPAL